MEFLIVRERIKGTEYISAHSRYSCQPPMAMTKVTSWLMRQRREQGPPADEAGSLSTQDGIRGSVTRGLHPEDSGPGLGGGERILAAGSGLAHLFVFENMGMGSSSCVSERLKYLLGRSPATPRGPCDWEAGPSAGSGSAVNHSCLAARSPRTGALSGASWLLFLVLSSSIFPSCLSVPSTLCWSRPPGPRLILVVCSFRL